MRHGSLYSGQGGFDLAAQWMGWENVFHCEWNPFCQTILNYYWPNAISYHDIKETDFTIHRGSIDVLTSGFPCQPVSTAGARKGTDDDRWGWPETRRAYNEIRPRVLICENVAGLFSILQPESVSEVEREAIELFCEDETYQVNSTIERIQRRVLGHILEEIRADGYVLPTYEDGTPIVFCIPACAVNAPHRRDRVWIVAFDPDQFNGNVSGFCSGEISQQQAAGICINNASTGSQPDDGRSIREPEERQESQSGGSVITDVIANSESGRFPESGFTRTGIAGSSNSNINGDASNSNSNFHERCEGPLYETRSEEAERYTGSFNSRNGRGTWENFPTESPVCDGNDGLSNGLDRITFSKWRQESIKGGGNAVVPQIPYRIFQILQELL